MVSQFGSLDYTIMGKTADLTDVQKTIIDTLHKEDKPQTFIAKEAGCSQSAVSKHVNRKLSGRKSVEEKEVHPTERTTALWGLSSKIDSRIWENFTRNGLRLGSRHQESPHTDVSRNLATVVVRGVLPGLKRRRTGLLPSGPKSSFQMIWGAMSSAGVGPLCFLKTNVTAPVYQDLFTKFVPNFGAPHASFYWPAF